MEPDIAIPILPARDLEETRESFRLPPCFKPRQSTQPFGAA